MKCCGSAFGVGFRWLLAITLVFAAAWLPEHGRTRTALPVSDQALQTFTVSTADDAGAGSLRQAITDANAAAGTDTIAFSVGTGPASILLSSELPDITGPVVIDGTTQPGFSGTPLIEVANFGLKITGGGSTVRSLIVNGGPGVVLETGGGNVVVGCRLTSLSDGVFINNSPNNLVGGTTAADSNNIGGNGYGVRITGSGSTGNVVSGNFIGLFSDSTDGRNSSVGVAIEGASNNRIGGTTVGERNVISNNGGGSTGTFNHFRGNVLITGAAATGNVVEGNYIGTNIAGTGDGAQTINGNRHNGVRIEDGGNNTVGGTVGTSPGGACTGACNLISANKTNGGVYITGSGATGNMVLGNFIGTNAAGTAIVSNPRGVTITAGASNNTIGGTTAAARNIISGAVGGLPQSDGGITIDGNSNTVQGNYIGTDTTGNQLLANFPNGILITGMNNTIGTATGTTFGGACTGGCNLITPASTGIHILGTTNPIGNNVVDYNYIGLNAAGTDALLGVNFPGAVWIVDSDQNTIGSVQSADHPAAETPPSDVPATLYCIQDAATGDYLQFDDQTGAFIWKQCRSGREIPGVGSVHTSVNGVIHLDAGYIRARTSTVTGRGAASLSYTRDELGEIPGQTVIQDQTVGNDLCECPTGGQQNLISGIYVRNGASDNVIAGNNINQAANDPDSNLTPGTSSPINHDSGSNNVYRANEISGTTRPSVVVASGIGDLLDELRVLQGYPTSIEVRPIDLNNDGRDINDPLDADGGANNTQNYATSVTITQQENGDYRLTLNYSSFPNGTFNVAVHGEDVRTSHGDRISRRVPIGAFELTTDASGNALIDRTFTDVDAGLIGTFDSITTLVTVVEPSTFAGDTSEYSDPAAVPNAVADFDNDGRTDISVFRPASGNGPSNWYILNSSDSSVRAQQFGVGTDAIVTGDFQRDGVPDFAVFRPANATWYNSRILGDPATNFDAVPWGNSTDIPVVGDFLNIGANQQAVFRPSEGNWYIRNPLDNTGVVLNFGLATDKLVPADYDGDGRTDPAIYRDGLWAVNPCIGCDAEFFQFGTTGDLPVAGDFDGDGVADIAVWRPSTGIWYLNQSTDGFTAFQWGTNNDVPVNGDFDGDGKNDIAVWRPSSGIWYILRSTEGFYAVQWGQNGDVPVPRFQN